MRAIKRVLSLLLAMVLVLSMVPAVFAETEAAADHQSPTGTYATDKWYEVGTVEELKTAMDNNNGANVSENAELTAGVKLTADLTVTAENAGKTDGALLYVGYYKDSTTYRGQALVLDLNGHTLTVAEDVTADCLFGAYGDSSFTVTNGIVAQGGTYGSSSAAVFLHGESKMTLDGVKWTLTDPNAKNTYGGMFRLGNSGNSLTVLNSDVTYATGTACRGSIIHDDGGATVTLKNSTLTGGNAVGGTVTDMNGNTTVCAADGGQIWLSAKAKLTAEDCTFTGGTADRNGGIVFKSAGSGTVTLTNCTFSGAEATNGGALFLGITGTVSVSDCTFTGNTASGNGGSIYKDAGSGKLTVTDSDFTGGSAVLGGQIYSTGTNANNQISGCTFTGGEAQRGGGLYITGKMRIGNSRITDHYATEDGGGLYVGGTGTVTLEGTTLDNASGARGGSVAKYGKGSLVMNDVEITGTAADGGSILVADGTATLNSGSVHDGEATDNGGNVYISRDGTVASKNLSYGIFVMNGGTVTGGDIHVSNGRCILLDGEVSDIQVHSKAAAETAAYVEGTTVTTVDMYDCLWIFGGKVDGITADSKHVNFVSGYAAANGVFTDLTNFPGSHSAVATEADDSGYLAVTHENTDEGNDINATCTATGVICVDCAQCVAVNQFDGTVYGGSFTYEEPVADHAWDEGVADPEPSCNDAGTRTYTCGTCGKTKAEVVDATGHSYSSVYTEATYEADAYTTHTCTLCGDSYVEVHENTMLRKTPPVATVTQQEKVTLEEDEYRVWNGIVSDNESESLVSGEGQMPLEVVVNFKAEDTLEECLAGGYSQWLVDFNITIEGLASDSFVADNCYLAGYYGSYGWIKIPLDGQTVENGVTYPVVALYDPTLNYKDICKSVKDFTAAIHIDQAILDANPDLQVKLELVMTNPNDATDTLQIGEDMIYTFNDLFNNAVAQNLTTGKIYADLTTALNEAKEGETVQLLQNINEGNLFLFGSKTLDLNGYVLTAAGYTIIGNDSHIVDSTEGAGMLVAEQSKFTHNANNASLPVWVEEGNVSGYCFLSVELKQSLKKTDENTAYFRFYIDNSDEDCLLQQIMATGGTDNGLYVQVALTWTDLNGVQSTRTYSYSAAMLTKYAQNWTGSEFRLTVTGMENVTELQLTAKLTYMENDKEVSAVCGDTKTLQNETTAN